MTNEWFELLLFQVFLNHCYRNILKLAPPIYENFYMLNQGLPSIIVLKLKIKNKKKKTLK